MFYMEQEARETPSAGAREAGDMTDVAVFDLESYVNVELDMKEDNGTPKVGHNVSATSKGVCHALPFLLALSFFFFSLHHFRCWRETRLYRPNSILM